jgi:hypothetical protein
MVPQKIPKLVACDSKFISDLDIIMSIAYSTMYAYDMHSSFFFVGRACPSSEFIISSIQTTEASVGFEGE